MSVTARIFLKEILSYFVSPIAYVILLVFLLVNGVTFYFYLSAFSGDLEMIVTHQYGFIPFWFLALLVPPLVTMRCFAEERRSGTYELLVTSGVAESRVVAGKFLAALAFYMSLWISVLPLFLLLEYLGDLNWGILTSVHVGLLLEGALFASVGLLASTLTQNQLVAASVAMVGALLLFFLHFFRYLFEPGRLELRYFDYVSPYLHFQSDFSRGVVDLRYGVLYGSLTLFFLFLATKSLERRRWW